MPHSPLEAFLSDTESAVKGSADPKVVSDAVAEALRRLIAAPFYLEDRHRQPSPDGIACHQVFRHPAGIFRLVSVVWAPKQATPIHDHGSWGVVAALDHHIVASGYRRLDDGSTPGFASLGEFSRALVSDLSLHVLRPGEDVIHRLENPFPDPAVTLHVFGAEPEAQSYFDTRAKSLMSVSGAWTIGV